MYKKKEAMMTRKAALEEAGLEAEAAASTAEDFVDADQETFDRVLAAVKKSVGSRAKEEAVAEEVTSKEEVSEEVDTAEASEEDLDTVEEPTELLIAEAGVEDEEGSLRAVASEWLGSVLRSTPKTN